MNIEYFDNVINNGIDDFYIFIKKNKNKDSINIIISNFLKKNEKNSLFNTIYLKYLYIYYILYNFTLIKDENIHKIIKTDLYSKNNPYENIVKELDIKQIINFNKLHNKIKTDVISSQKNDKKTKKFVDIIGLLLKDYKSDLEHNIIKSIILYELYIVKDRIELFNNITFNSKSETKIIDIVIKNKSIFDFNILTELLSLEEETSVIEWYELIMNYDKYTKSTLTINEKMNYIFDSNIKIYPIVDDIQLYHKRDLRIFDNMSRKDTRASISTNYIRNQIIEKKKSNR